MIEGFIIENEELKSYNLRETYVEIPYGVKVIGNGSFKGCTSIEEVFIPESVTHIMNEAFKGCRKLKKINFPDNLAFIGDYAFHRCHFLKSINLPMSTKKIGNCAFLYCDNLEYASLPGVLHIGKQGFLNDLNLKTIIVSNELDLLSINEVFLGCYKISKIILSSGEDFNIDNTIDLLSSHKGMNPMVIAIVRDIFKIMEIKEKSLIKFLVNLTNVEIPRGINIIERSCFFDKKGIVSVKFPDTIVKIGNCAFKNCINLERVEFANDNVEISNDAFKNCTTLKHIITSDGVNHEIKGLPDEYEKKVPAIVKTIHNQILNNFLISGTTLIKYRGSEERVVVPDGITVISERAFSQNEIIDRVVLPDTVEEIHEEAFLDCLVLQNINFPNRLKAIYKSAFENCVKLIRVILPESIVKIEKSTFSRCKKLKEVKFGENLKEIDDLAFYNCQSLEGIEFPESIVTIGHMGFYKCYSLKEVRLPKSLIKLGSNVFTASGVKCATVEGNIDECGIDVFSECNKLNELNFCEGVTSIGDKFAFRCKYLKYINIPQSMEYIGKNAFEDSIFLESLQGGIYKNFYMDGSKVSGDIIIPEGIISICGGAFYGNLSITYIKLPKTLKNIGSRAFCGLTSLKRIIIPKSVTRIEEGTFAYCSNLEEIFWDGDILFIGDNAFYGCKKLVHINSFNGEYIGKNAFNGCERLLDLKVKSKTIDENAFRNAAFIKDISIVSNIVVNGREFAKNAIIPEGVVSISAMAFCGNEDLETIIFPKSLVSIGDSAFIACKNLKKLEFNSEIKYIGKSAFKKCTSLKEVYITTSNIEKDTFAYCINLEKVTLNETISIEDGGFCGCINLRELTCSKLESVYDNSFDGCESLRNFDFSNIKFIGKNAFHSCNGIKEINLNEDVFISAHGFEDCGNLEKIIISGDKLSLGSYAFSGCTFLKEITIKDKTYLIDDYLILFNKDIPNAVKYIYASAISCFDIDEDFSINTYRNRGRIILIPDGIKKIGCEVFRDAINVQEIYIPKTVKEIGERAFHNTKWLENKSLISKMVIVNGILIDGTKCEGDIVIPEDVKVVEGWAFANCFNLKSVKFTNPKIIIKEYAFRNCINLKKTIDFDGKVYLLNNISDRDNEDLPKTIKQIFKDSYNCFKMEGDTLIECTGNIKDLVLPKGINLISDGVFKESNLLTNLSLNEDVQLIGNNAFEMCKWLVLVKNFTNVKSIGKRAFSNCYSLEKIENLNSLEYIGVRAFEHCISLESIELPEGIVEIPEKAFYRCKSLKKIKLPSTLKKIGKEAFAFCYELEEISISKDTEISERAFAWCSKVKTYEI